MADLATAQDLRQHYADVRRRLRNPVSARRDIPIKLREDAWPERIWVTDLSWFKTVNAGSPVQGRFGLEPWIAGGVSIPTLPNIIRAVCAYYKVSQREMESPRRSDYIVVPRHVAMYLCKELTKSSLVQIGGMFSNRDHSSVVYAIKRIERDIVENKKLARDILQIGSRFAGSTLRCVSQRGD